MKLAACKPEELCAFPAQRPLFIAAAAAASAIGLLVLAGWHLHNPTLIRFLSGMAPMAYNAALGFFICGGSLAALAFGEKRPAIPACAYALAIGGLTLAEYATGADFGIGQVFMKAYLSASAAHPGRLPLNAAVCWLLMGLSLLLMTRGGGFGRRGLALWVLGLTIILISVVSFLGYLSGTTLGHSWGPFPSMPFHGALAWMLLGVCVTAYSLSQPVAGGYLRRDLARAAFGIALALLGAAGYLAYREMAAAAGLGGGSGESLKGAGFLLLVVGGLGAALFTLVFYFLGREIRARELAEAELLRAREEALSASKAKSDFIASMSHELRTPLNAIIGFSEVLEDAAFGPLNEKQKKYVLNILAAGGHLLALINDILDVTKVESGKMELRLEYLNLVELLERAVALFRGRADERGVKLALGVSAEFPRELAVDERKLKQVLFNLLSNAFKFTPAGGAVRLEAGANAEGEPEISVTDAGPVLSAAEQGRLFAPFMQLPGAKDGTGLGLFLSREMVGLWGGKIGVVSPAAEGAGGCRFYFTLGKRKI